MRVVHSITIIQFFHLESGKPRYYPSASRYALLKTQVRRSRIRRTDFDDSLHRIFLRVLSRNARRAISSCRPEDAHAKTKR